jgi:predicted RNase H-like HicB family nuclease
VRFLIIIEKGKRNYSAYAPDVPGCITTGKNVEEIKRNMREALEFHLESLRRAGDKLPEATTQAGYVDVALPAKKGKLVKRVAHGRGCFF